MSNLLSAMRTHIDRLPAGFTGAQRVRSILGGLLDQCGSYETLKESPDPVYSQATNDKTIAAARTKLQSAIDAARAAVNTEIAAANSAWSSEQTKAANLVPDQYAAEIREVFRSLDSAAKLKFLEDGIDQLDSQTLSAIFCAPISIVGMSASLRDNFVKIYLEKVSPGDRTNDLCLLADGAAEALDLAQQISH